MGKVIKDHQKTEVWAKTILLVAATAMLLIAQPLFASEESVQSFTLDGRLYANSAATEGLADTGTITIQIVDSTQSCVLYEETQSFDTTLTDGNFNIRVGESTSTHSKRSSGDSGHTLASVFANRGGSLSGKKVTDLSACSGSLSAGSMRYVRIIVSSSSNPTPHAMSPFVLDSTPTSWVAETLQGLGPTSFINVNNNSPAVLTQANVESVFSDTNYPILMGILGNGANGYVQNASNGSIPLPAIAGTPASPSAGQMWYDSGALKFWDGSTAQTIGVNSSGTSGGIPYYSSASTMASSAALTQYGVVYGGGAGAAPAATAAGTTGYLLTSAGGTGAPTFSQIDLASSPAITGILPVANGGTGSGTQNFVDLTTAQTVAGVKTWSSNAVFSSSVGIGTTTPAAALDIAGQVYSRSKNNAASLTFDFNNGNVQYTSANCGAVTLQNMQDGGSYTVVVQGTTAATCTFSNGGDSFKFIPANSATIAGTQAVYNMTKVGSTVYVNWTTGY